MMPQTPKTKLQMFMTSHSLEIMLLLSLTILKLNGCLCLLKNKRNLFWTSNNESVTIYCMKHSANQFPIKIAFNNTQF
jgi:hypothetical protein